jgi:hypothetical protein
MNAEGLKFGPFVLQSLPIKIRVGFLSIKVPRQLKPGV